MNLPERLKNKGIVPYTPGEKVKVTLSEQKVKSLGEILLPLMDKKEAPNDLRK